VKGGADVCLSERTVEECPAALSEEVGIEKQIERAWG
jgi:hypothetical protein